MERFFSERVNSPYNSCRNCKNAGFVIPSCINDDFCVMPPSPRNSNPVLAMAFVEMQPIEGLYTEGQALCRGTLFKNLDMPFYGGNKK